MSSTPDRARLLEGGRTNQKRRTRQALLDAGARLVAEGRSPTLAEVAEDALVSRTTAYRYFASVEALLGEAFFEQELPTAERLFADPVGEPVERVLRVEEALNGILFAQEVSTHLVVRNTIDAWLASAPDDRPVRPGRRLPLLDAALEPLAATLGPARLRRLRDALALACGTEAVLATRDVCGLEVAEAREVTRWASAALVRQALLEGG
jgi:AcrR family transcriptional regulator